MVLALLLTLHLAMASGAERDLVRNGGFEEGMVGWTYDGEHLEDPLQAHSGRACVVGEVTQPNQARILRQRVSLRADALYRLRFWARASGGTKIAIWLRQDKQRWNLAQLEKVPPKWELFEVNFSPPAAGEFEVELVAPSSHNAPPGRTWVDDVALLEHLLPPTFSLSTPERFADFPALSADAQGSLYAAWVEFEKGRDFLWAAVLQPQGEKPKASLFPIPLPGSSVESVALAGEAQGAWGCVAVETKEGWDLWAFRLGPQGLQGKPWPLTSDAATDIRPALAVSGPQVWVVWESNREGRRQIYGAPLMMGRSVEPQRLSDGADSCSFPVLVGDGKGGLWAAWEQFSEGQYDIYLASFHGATWEPSRRLTANPWLEHRPSLAWTPEGLWVAWEVREFTGYRTSQAIWQRVLAARLRGETLEAPENAWDALPLWCTQPRLLRDSQGRLHLCARRSRGQHEGWETVLFTFDGQRWQGPQLLSVGFGRNRPAPLAEAGGRLWVALQEDNLRGRWNTAEESLNARSEVRLASLTPEEGIGRKPLRLVPLRWPETSFDPQVLRQQRGEERRGWSIQVNGQRLRLFFGQFHEHSEISVCNRRGDLPPEDNYAIDRDLHRLDFAALTDHGYNQCPALWAYTSKLARWQEDPGRFLTFLAEEWTSTFERYTEKHPQGFYGHRNLIFADVRFPRWFNAFDRSTPADIWSTLRKMGANFIHIPHQLADTGNVPIDWEYVDEVAQPIAEIFQARGSYEYEGAPRQAGRTVQGHFLQDAWAQGVIIGVIASPDHGGGLGKAAVYAEGLSREAILEACRARHTYGTTAAKILLEVRVNGRLMGEKLPLTDQPATVFVRVSAPGEIEAVEICKNNRFIYTKEGEGTEALLTFRDNEPPTDGTFYYVRVRQKDGEIAWASPVWFLEPSRFKTLQHREGLREVWEEP